MNITRFRTSEHEPFLIVFCTFQHNFLFLSAKKNMVKPNFGKIVFSLVRTYEKPEFCFVEF